MLDAGFLMIILVVIAIAAYPLVQIFDDVNAGVQSEESIDTRSKAVINTHASNLPFTFDTIMLIMLIGGYVAIFILAFQIRTSPALLFAAALFITVLITVVPSLANAWFDVQADFGEANDFVIIPFVLNNYLLLTIVLWGLVAFGLYAKRQTG